MKIFLSVLVLFSSFACKDFVSDVAPYTDRVNIDELNDQASVDFLINGLVNQLSLTVDRTFLTGDLLADQLIFDPRNTKATFLAYQVIDQGSPMDNNTENTQGFLNAQELRLMADTLVYKANNQIKFTDNNIKNRALYAGKFYSAFAYYLLGTYFGKDQVSGGAPINLSHFKSTTVLYQTAIDKWNEALNYTTNAYNIRLINSLIGRIYLFMGDYTNAAIYVAKGLISGDAPFVAQYNTLSDNYYRLNAGEVRVQCNVDPRFNTYVTNDPTEAARIQLKKSTFSGASLYSQIKYVLQPDNVTVTPIVIIDWQENNLMEAELAVRGNMAGNPVSLINAVRASRINPTTKLPVSSLSSSTAITLADPTTSTTYSIYVERDKELWLRGDRLIDERRFGKFHLQGMWEYLPIPYSEKIQNPYWNN